MTEPQPYTAADLDERELALRLEGHPDGRMGRWCQCDRHRLIATVRAADWKSKRLAELAEYPISPEAMAAAEPFLKPPWFTVIHEEPYDLQFEWDDDGHNYLEIEVRKDGSWRFLHSGHCETLDTTIATLRAEVARLREAVSAAIGHLQWSTGGWGPLMKPNDLRAGMTTLRGYVAELEAALAAPGEREEAL